MLGELLLTGAMISNPASGGLNHESITAIQVPGSIPSLEDPRLTFEQEQEQEQMTPGEIVASNINVYLNTYIPGDFYTNLTDKLNNDFDNHFGFENTPSTIKFAYAPEGFDGPIVLSFSQEQAPVPDEPETFTNSALIAIQVGPDGELGNLEIPTANQFTLEEISQLIEKYFNISNWSGESDWQSGITDQGTEIAFKEKVTDEYYIIVQGTSDGVLALYFEAILETTE